MLREPATPAQGARATSGQIRPGTPGTRLSAATPTWHRSTGAAPAARRRRIATILCTPRCSVNAGSAIPMLSRGNRIGAAAATRGIRQHQESHTTPATIKLRHRAAPTLARRTRQPCPRRRRPPPHRARVRPPQLQQVRLLQSLRLRVALATMLPGPRLRNPRLVAAPATMLLGPHHQASTLAPD